MTKKELNRLKKSLPKGYRDMLAEKLNCTTSMVDMVLAGTRKNLDIISTAIEIAKAHKKKMSQLSQEINQL